MELHGTAFRLGDRCVAIDGGGRAHIKRTDCTLVCTPIEVNSGVVVEVAPKPEHRTDAPAGDAWLNPNRWPQLAAKLMDPAARFAFTAATIPTADAGEADGFAYLEIATTATKEGDRHTRRVKLMRAAGWAKEPSRRPRDVRRDALGQKGDAESAGRYPLEFQSDLDVDDFMRHAGECSEALRAQASQGAAPKRGPKEPPVVRLSFTDRKVAVRGTQEDALLHRPGGDPLTMSPDVEVLQLDWAAVTGALAELPLTSLRLEVWPAGVLRFTAETELATILIWIPLVDPHSRTRSYAVLGPMEFAPWPRAEPAVAVPAAAPAGGDGQQ